MDLKGKHVLVVGLGESGLAMARWLHRQGARVRVADSRPVPPNKEALAALSPEIGLHAGAFRADDFAGADLIALSPGVPLASLPDTGLPVVSEIELFAAGVRQYAAHARIIGITGSNGKTTTTALTAHLLNGAGVSAVACGNISPSALDALMAAADAGTLPSVWVVELSSFQLETTHHLNADAATVLNVSEDHLDRYEGSLANYAHAKGRVFQGKGVMVLNRDDDYSMANGRCGRKMVTFGLTPPAREQDWGIDLANGLILRGKAAVLKLGEQPLSGLHNAANIMAAFALCEALGIAAERLLAPLQGFCGLPHRVEQIADKNGVVFVDDSKGTNVGATLAAIEGLGRPVAIVLGGEGKGQDFSPLKAALARHGRAVALIGRDAPAIEAAIAGCGLPLCRATDMAEAVRWLAGQAVPGDCVLLSPACASLDMYRNYAHRAESFIAAVEALPC